jgi:hypothetical protein
MPAASPIASATQDAASPIASAPQHLLALQRANRVRLARAALKRSVAAGERDVAEIILECPWESESMSISELLSAQRRWGRTRSRKLIVSLGLTENKRVGALVQRQRLLLASALRAKSGCEPPTADETLATPPPRPLIAV